MKNWIVVKYGREHAILDIQSRAYVLFGTKREMVKRARELNANWHGIDRTREGSKRANKGKV